MVLAICYCLAPDSGQYSPHCTPPTEVVQTLACCFLGELECKMQKSNLRVRIGIGYKRQQIKLDADPLQDCVVGKYKPFSGKIVT